MKVMHVALWVISTESLSTTCLDFSSDIVSWVIQEKIIFDLLHI